MTNFINTRFNFIKPSNTKLAADNSSVSEVVGDIEPPEINPVNELAEQSIVRTSQKFLQYMQRQNPTLVIEGNEEAQLKSIIAGKWTSASGNLSGSADLQLFKNTLKDMRNTLEQPRQMYSQNMPTANPSIVGGGNLNDDIDPSSMGGFTMIMMFLAQKLGLISTETDEIEASAKSDVKMKDGAEWVLVDKNPFEGDGALSSEYVWQDGTDFRVKKEGFGEEWMEDNPPPVFLSPDQQAKLDKLKTDFKIIFILILKAFQKQSQNNENLFNKFG